MARHAGTRWNLPEGTPTPGGGTSRSWEAIHTALLMDIRDELQNINATLRCPNFVAIPTVLRSINRNTTKRKRATKAQGR